MKKAVYPGSFDPITNGHLDIIHRAVKIFDVIYVSVADNPAKSHLFTVEERKTIIRSVFQDQAEIVVDSFSGLLSDYVKKLDTNLVIRGLRAVTDFDYELSFALMNQKLNSELETIFFMTNEKLSFVSSSLIKEVSRFGGDLSGYVPELVMQKLQEKYKM